MTTKVFDIPVDDAARRVGVHVETLKRYARQGKVPAVKTMSGRWMFAVGDLDGLAIHVVVVDA
jgi:predicted site-specific integrase-resolvase